MTILKNKMLCPFTQFYCSDVALYLMGFGCVSSKMLLYWRNKNGKSDNCPNTLRVWTVK